MCVCVPEAAQPDVCVCVCVCHPEAAQPGAPPGLRPLLAPAPGLRWRPAVRSGTYAPGARTAQTGSLGSTPGLAAVATWEGGEGGQGTLKLQLQKRTCHPILGHPAAACSCCYFGTLVAAARTLQHMPWWPPSFQHFFVGAVRWTGQTGS